MRVLAVFADDRFAQSKTRIVHEANSLGLFDRVVVETRWRPAWLQECPWYQPSQPGGGYYSWKSRLIRDTLQSLADNDTLVYCDAGCELRPSSQWDELFQMLDTDEVVAFQLNGAGVLEVEWTKRCVFTEFGVELDNVYYSQTNQLVGGVSLWKNTPGSRALASEWCRLTAKLHLVDDSHSQHEDAAWKGSRHDQSVWSMLVKRSMELNSVRVALIHDPTWPPRQPDQAISASRLRV